MGYACIRYQCGPSFHKQCRLDRFHYFSCVCHLFQVGDGIPKRPYYLSLLVHNLEVHTIYYVCHLHQLSFQVEKFNQKVHKLLQMFIGSP